MNNNTDSWYNKFLKPFLKLVLSCLFIFFYFISANAQNFIWAKSSKGARSDESWSVATDASGNVYATGYFTSRTITFGSVTLTNSSSTSNYLGGRNFFLVKYDMWGNVLWAKRAGGTGDDFGCKVTTDKAGNVYVTGVMRSYSIIFGTYTLYSHGT